MSKKQKQNKPQAKKEWAFYLIDLDLVSPRLFASREEAIKVARYTLAHHDQPRDQLVRLQVGRVAFVDPSRYVPNVLDVIEYMETALLGEVMVDTDRVFVIDDSRSEKAARDLEVFFARWCRRYVECSLWALNPPLEEVDVYPLDSTF